METNLSAVARNTKRIYFDADLRMKGVPKVCAAGCSHCCHQIVKIHFAEGPAIGRFITEEIGAVTRIQLRQNVSEWFEYFDASTPTGRPLTEQDISEFSAKVTAERRPCPMLVDNKCSIYKARPLVCRTHSVNDSADACQETPNRNGDVAGIEIQRSALHELARASDMMGIRLLPYAIKDALGVKHACKPVALAVTPTLRGGHI